MELGRGNLGGGRGDHSHQWTINIILNIGQSLVSREPLFGDWNLNHSIMSTLSGHGDRT